MGWEKGMTLNAEYRVNPSAPLEGISIRGTLSIAPSILVSLFGTPVRWKGGKEPFGAYVYVGPDGAVITFYTMAHDTLPEQIVEMQAAFWLSDKSQDFHVGATSDDDADLFVRWLAAQFDAFLPKSTASRAKWMSTRTIMFSCL
jgi:hypothetical protein